MATSQHVVPCRPQVASVLPLGLNSVDAMVSISDDPVLSANTAVFFPELTSQMAVECASCPKAMVLPSGVNVAANTAVCPAKVTVFLPVAKSQSLSVTDSHSDPNLMAAVASVLPSGFTHATIVLSFSSLNDRWPTAAFHARITWLSSVIKVEP